MQKLSAKPETINTENLMGFRLKKLEVLNWGTFGQHIWKIESQGYNSLLTGDIGSGKSTLVDALTTLLVPHQKITYNKAAGAEGKERTILSYIRGEYKNEKDEQSNLSKSVYLRDESSYSVLLAHFANSGFDQDICLAQVFWLKNGKPEKFFLVSGCELSIKEHFTNFGPDIMSLKKQLRKIDTVELTDRFSEYSSRFRNIFGIKSDKALDLFYQTVSMKSVGNLTEFVRNQMLEKFDVKSKIDELKKRFEDLNESHKAVQKAREQLDKLNPLVQKAGEYKKISQDIDFLSSTLDALPGYFASEKASLLEDEILIINKELKRIENKITELNDDLQKLRDDELEIAYLIKNHEHGKRLNKVESEIRLKTELKNKKMKEADKYSALASVLDLPDMIEESVFYQSISEVKEIEEQLKADLTTQTKKRDELTIKSSQDNKRYRELILEYDSLQNRKTQIPDNNLRIRQHMIQALGLEEGDIPYVGELLKVKDRDKSWEGAIEKLLHNFGLSMLVPEEHYRAVSQFVNSVNLKGRLVYFRVPKFVVFNRNFDNFDHSLLNKIEIKPGNDFSNWLRNELFERYNYICCETMEEFQRQPLAITKEGQIKVKNRHEKDDRVNIHDRKHYILGWSNTEKLQAIQNEAAHIEKDLKITEQEFKVIEGKQEFILHKRDCVRDFLRFTEFNAINWHREVSEIQELLEEKKELESSSNELKTLNDRLIRLRIEEIKPRESELSLRLEFKGKNEQSLQKFNQQLEECKQLISSLDAQLLQRCFAKIREFIPQDENFDLDSVEKLHTELRNKINKEKNNVLKAEQELREDLIAKMGNYKNDYPAETSEVDVSISSLPEFEKFHEKLVTDALPKHEEKFKKLLNEGTIQGIVLFKNQLEIFEKDIEEKIRDINSSLVEIDYNPGTFILIDLQKSQDKQIREFKEDLSSCLELEIGEEEIYNEKKFSEVKKILDRFNSSDNEDINWTNKVTDVRNWFTFTVSERWREDNSEKEFYSDSSGKSGGQKEKLAYTILAAALAYQFGLDWHETKSKSFRFVVIDEAFGRGSDESTRYALELFKKLNLQLLIVTPLQKINIIEDYISSVHFVSNQGGRNSVVRNLTKTEYKKEKIRYLNLEVQGGIAG